MRSIKTFLSRVLFAFAAAFVPRGAWACALCFGGDPGSGWSRGFFWGILLLLCLPFLIAGGMISWIARSIRRNKAHE